MRAHAVAQTAPHAKRICEIQVLTQSDLAERYAAVCEGAVRYLPDLRAFANALARNPHQADDLAQSTIVRALDASHQFTPGTNFKAWTFLILRNIFYNQWRSRASRQIALEECEEYTPSTEPCQDSAMEFCDLRRAFSQLGSDQRQALLLIGVSELSYDNAAEICGVAKGTMKSRVSRARGSLRLLMDGGPLKLSRRDVVPITSLEAVSALKSAGKTAAGKALR